MLITLVDFSKELMGSRNWLIVYKKQADRNVYRNCFQNSKAISLPDIFSINENTFSDDRPNIEFFTFLTLETLTFDLGPWPSNSFEIWCFFYVCQILGPEVQRFNLQSKNRQTDKHIDASENITSSANWEVKITHELNKCQLVFIRLACLGALLGTNERGSLDITSISFNVW